MSRRAVLALVAAASVVAGCGDESRPAADIAFIRSTPHSAELVVGDAEGEGIEVLVGGPFRQGAFPFPLTPPAWTPDGERIAFAANGPPEPDYATARIQLMRPEEGARRRRIGRSGATGPVWSPDGRTIAFARVRIAGRRSGSLWAMTSDGADPVRLTRAVPGRIDEPGSFTPDGSRLAFTRTTCAPPGRGGCFEPRSAIFTVRLNGSGLRRLLDRAQDPAFSPDGRSIAFATDRDENGEFSYAERTFFANELYVTDAEGGRPRRLTRTRSLNERRPSWSPSGQRIVFQRGDTIGNAEATSLHAINPDGTCARTVLADPDRETWYSNPAWKPGSRSGGRLDC